LKKRRIPNTKQNVIYVYVINLFMINLFFWKCRAIQLNLPLPSITTSFFSPIGLHGYEKGKLGLHAIKHYMWQSINKKKDFILWKLSSIQMKILNDIACNLNSNTLNGIQIWLHWNLFGIKLNWREIRCKLVKNILEICSWQWYWEKTLKRQNFENTPFHFFLLVNWLNKF